MTTETIRKKIDEAKKAVEAVESSILLQSKYMDSLKDEGRNEVWELIKEIDKISSRDMVKEIFGYDCVYDIIPNLTPQEALEKYNKYKKEFEVGDVVHLSHSENLDIRDIPPYGVITYMYDGNVDRQEKVFEVLLSNGDYVSCYNYEVEKTGERADIQNVLKQIGGVANG